MANQTPVKFKSGKLQGFESGDTVSVGNGGLGLATIAANRIPYASALDTYSTSSSFTFDGTILSSGRMATGDITCTGTAGVNNGAIIMQHVGAPSASQIQWVFSVRSNDKDLYLYSYDNSTFKNWQIFDYANDRVDFISSATVRALGNFSVSGNSTFANYLSLTGSGASAGSGVRNIHAGGTSTSFYYNVLTSGTHNWSVNGSVIGYIDSNGLHMETGNYDVCFASGRGIRNNTSDGSDNGSVLHNGGGGFGDTRGSYCNLYGNEHATKPGYLDLSTGDVAGALLRLYTGSGSGTTLRFQINGSGTVSGSIINAANGICGIGSGGYVAQAQLGSGSGGAGAKVLADNQTWIDTSGFSSGSAVYDKLAMSSYQRRTGIGSGG